MIIEQSYWTESDSWTSPFSEKFKKKANLVFIFGNRKQIEKKELIAEIRMAYPTALLVGCSTAGEICDTRVLDSSLVVTAIIFEKTQLKSSHIEISGPKESYEAGKKLGSRLDPKGLVQAIILSDGLKINGSELVKGLLESLPENVGLTGGLAGDGNLFEKTLVFSGNLPKSGNIVLLGFYGDQLRISYGSMGGFLPFGPERLVTKAKGNVLYELDDQPIIELYKKYLGDEKGTDLAKNQFNFPLSFRTEEMKTPIVRTILAIDEKSGSMTFAGDISEGGYCRLMKTNFDRLIDGAKTAAKTSLSSMANETPDLALLISCVGRKIILNQRVEEEVEAVRDVIGYSSVITGFYSYGEIAHFNQFERCELHNQTMTITTFKED
jgi:hypothetical protein